jgi:hypothetical protein
MKKLILILLFSTVVFSSSSYAEWTDVNKDTDGNTFYVDLEKIKEHDGYVYYWSLVDYLKPTPNGVLSVKIYKQGDCKLFRFKRLSYSFHKEPMGGGNGDSNSPKNLEWVYSPNSTSEAALRLACVWVDI